MTVVRSYLPPRREDAPDLPDETWSVLQTISEQVQVVTEALQKRVDDANENVQIKDLELVNNTSEDVQVNIRGAPQEVQVIFAEVAVTAFFWEVLNEDEIRVIVTFAGDTATTTSSRVVRLRIAGGSTPATLFPEISPGEITIAPEGTPVQGADHNQLINLTVGDPHPQYLFLAGRAGGQNAFGGTGVGDELNLTGSTDAALGRIQFNSPIEIADVSAGDQIPIRYRPTFTASAVFIGGFQSAAADVTVTNAVFIWALLADNTTFRQGVAPGFAAFTLFNALSVITNSGNFNLFSALVLNVGVVHQRLTSGTSTTTSTIGMNFSPQTRASVSGAVMTKTIGSTAIQVSPTFSTVTGSTVNLGTIRGLLCNAPAVALFQPQTGTENLTAYYGIDFTNITFASTGDKVVVRSAMTDAADRFFLQNNGGARSDLGGGNLLDCGFVQILSDTATLSLGAGAGDVQIGWNGTNLEFDPIVGDNLLFGFSTVATRDTYTWQAQDFGVSETAYTELNLGFDRFAMGQTSAVGNQVGVFVAPSRTVNVAGGWADFLLTQAGNLDINGFVMSDLSAWAVNSISLDALGGGSIADIATFRIGGMTTSLVSSNITAALDVTGRSHLSGSLGLDPITPATLTANVNDYQGHGTNNSQRATVRASSDASRNVTGFDAAISRDGDTIWFINVGANDIVLQDQNAGSVATNRIISPTGADLTLNADEAALLWYDPTDTRWRILYHTGA